MFCYKCGAEIIEGALFCMKCGTKVPVIDGDNLNVSEGKGETEQVEQTEPTAEELFNEGVLNLKNNNFNDCIKLFEASAQKGYYDAMIVLAKIFFKEKDFDNAILWAEKAIEEGIPGAQEIYDEGVQFFYAEEALKNNDKAAYRDIMYDFFQNKCAQNDSKSIQYLKNIFPGNNGVLEIPALLKNLHTVLYSEENQNESDFRGVSLSISKDLSNVSREQIAELLYDAENSKYCLPVGGDPVYFEDGMNEIASINAIYNEYTKKALEDFEKFYNDSNGIGRIINRGYDLAIELLEGAAAISISFCEKGGRFDLTKSKIIKNSGYYDFGHRNSPLDVWNDYYNSVKNAVQKIHLIADQEKENREIAKENRTRVIGGGFGFRGAVNGMIEAGAINMLTGAGYSLINSIGNMSTDMERSRNEDALFNNPSTLKTLIYGLTQSIDLIKMDTICFVNLSGIYNHDGREKCAAIMKNISDGVISKANLEKALKEALLLDPFNIEIYRKYIQEFGDKGNALHVLAKFLGIENDILLIKKEYFEDVLKRGVLKKGKQLWEALKEIGAENPAEYVYLQTDLATVQKDYILLNELDQQVSFGDERIADIIERMGCIMNAFDAKKRILSDNKQIAPMQYLNQDITEIFIPEGVEIIHDYAFANCKQLKKVVFPDSLKEIGIGAFWGCKKAFANLKEKESAFLPPSIKSIKSAAFRECGFKDVHEIIVPQGCIHYGLDAFIQTIRLPDSVTSVDGYSRNTFYIAPHHDTYLYKYFRSNGLMEQTGIATDCDVKEFLATYEKKSAESAWNHFSKDSVPEIVQDVYSHAFKDVEVGRFDFNWHLDSIDTEAFAGIHMESLVFNTGHKISYIGMNAFSDSYIKAIKFKNFVENVEDYAFSNCPNLESVIFEKGVAVLGNGVFQGCNSLKQLVLPDTLTSIGENIIDCAETEIICTSRDCFAYRYCQEHDISVSISSGNRNYDLAEKYKDSGEKEKAFAHYKKAAEDEFVPAYHELAEFYDMGIGTQRDKRQALYWYSRSVESGIAKSNAPLGNIYLNGDDEIAPEKFKGLRYLMDGVNALDANAMNLLGLSYFKGLGGVKNIKEALKWFKCASDLKNSSGTSNFQTLSKKYPSLMQNIYCPSPPNITDRELILTNLPAYIEYILDYYDCRSTGLYFSEQGGIASEKISQAMNAYATLKKNERPIACFDATFFGGAEDGFLISSEGVFIHNDGEKGFYFLHNVFATNTSPVRVLANDDSEMIIKLWDKDYIRDDELIIKIKCPAHSRDSIDTLRSVFNQICGDLEYKENDLKNRYQDLLAGTVETKSVPEVDGKKPSTNETVANESASKNPHQKESSEKTSSKKSTVNESSLEDISERVKTLKCLYFPGEGAKSDKKIRNAIGSYAAGASNENVILCHDSTVFGSATDGFLVTDRKIYGHTLLQDNVVVELKDIREIKFEGERKDSSLLSLRIYCNGSNETIDIQTLYGIDDIEDAKVLKATMDNILHAAASGQKPDANAQKKKFCGKCGHPVKEGNSFCPNCGKKL